MQMTRKQKYRRVLLALAALFLILAVLLGYDAMRESLPDTMYVDENSESPFQPLTKHPLLTISEDTKEAEKNEFGETGETVVECSAAGIPLKKIRVIQEERPKVAVCGAPVGIYMETDGVMVIRTAEIRSSDGTVSRPSENILREGDYITKVNGQSIRSKQELIDAVKVSNGSPVYLSLLRDGETIEVQVTPQKSQDGTCRLGAWVRDNMQGIGTLTFVEPDGTFAALGHGISDIDTGKMLQLNGGELYLTQILSVIPGKAGVPGELQGVIHYEEKNRIGLVAENTIYGIHGVLDREKSSALPLTVTEIAYRQEIETGPATVRMCVDNTVEEYEAEITWKREYEQKFCARNYRSTAATENRRHRTGKFRLAGAPERKADRRHYPCFRKPSRKRLRCLCGKHACTELKKYALIWLKLLQTSEFLRKMSIEFSKNYGKYIENAKK